LLAGLQIFEGHRLHRLHGADRFGDGGGDPCLDDPFDDRERCTDFA
jgi:hypothetical protein